MSHKEDLLDGAVRCLRDKGYARTTARDIVAASGTNLASIGYHYGSLQALLNAAVMKAMDDFGTEMAGLMQELGDGPLPERFERFWTHVIDSFRDNPGLWMATFDTFSVAQHDPDIRVAIADGIEDGRKLWAQAVYGLSGADDKGRAVGALHQALISGVVVQWLIDPERAPSAADLTAALRAIAQLTGHDPQAVEGLD